MSKAIARLATPEPMRPMPMTPSVLPRSSTPTYFLRFHSPLCIVSFAIGMLRDIASIMAIVCSVAAIVLPPGELMTMMPLAVAAGISMLSTPTPARPMILSFSARAMTSAVTFEAERTISASKSGIISSSSSAGSLSLTTTSKSFCKSSMPFGEIPSAANTFMILLSLSINKKSARPDLGRNARFRGATQVRQSLSLDAVTGMPV